jgi:hypothetical protein
MRFLSGLAAIAVLGLGISPAAADEGKETKLKLSEVPKKVLRAVKKKFPGAKLLGAEKEIENKKTIYEINLKYKGHKYDVTFTPGGKLIEIEKTIAVKDLPEAVTEALNKKYPKATFKKAEEVTKGKKVVFEVVLVTQDKKSFEVVVSPEGKILEEESKDKKKEKDDD